MQVSALWWFVANGIDSKPYETKIVLKAYYQDMMEQVSLNPEKLPRAQKWVTDFFDYNISGTRYAPTWGARDVINLVNIV